MPTIYHNSSHLESELELRAGDSQAYWGGRYNGEMKRLMVEHAFRSVKRVIFIVGPDNHRSQRAVEKIGGVRVGTITDAHGRERVVYELTPELFARRQGSAAA